MEKPDRLPAANCCGPTHPVATPREMNHTLRSIPEHLPSHGDVPISAMSFQMGDNSGQSYAIDGEAPAHTAGLEALRVDTAAVTDKQSTAAAGSCNGSGKLRNVSVRAGRANPDRDDFRVASGSPKWLTVTGVDQLSRDIHQSSQAPREGTTGRGCVMRAADSTFVTTPPETATRLPREAPKTSDSSSSNCRFRTAAG